VRNQEALGGGKKGVLTRLWEKPTWRKGGTVRGDAWVEHHGAGVQTGGRTEGGREAGGKGTSRKKCVLKKERKSPIEAAL